MAELYDSSDEVEPEPNMPASRYVSIYMARTQAEEAVKALRWMAEGRAKSNPLWKAIKTMEDAMRVHEGTA